MKDRAAAYNTLAYKVVDAIINMLPCDPPLDAEKEDLRRRIQLLQGKLSRFECQTNEQRSSSHAGTERPPEHNKVSLPVVRSDPTPPSPGPSPDGSNLHVQVENATDGSNRLVKQGNQSPAARSLPMPSPEDPTSPRPRPVDRTC